MAQPSLQALQALQALHSVRLSPPPAHAATAPGTDDLPRAPRFGDVERRAFEELLALYWHPVLTFSTRLLHDGEAANDVTQETFSRIWINRATTHPEQLRAYIFRVARNLVIDEIRRRSLRAHATRTADDAGDSPTIRRPDQVVEQDEQHAAIQHAVDELPPRRREAFILAYLHELSYKEAAAVLGVSPATVKNHVAMALVDLRRSLARHAHPCE